MNTGFTLQTGQQLLGSGIPHTFATQIGSVVIPALTSIAPTITNGGDVVILANNTEVSGFNINVNTTFSGVFGNGISNIIVTNNNIQNTAGTLQGG